MKPTLRSESKSQISKNKRILRTSTYFRVALSEINEKTVFPTLPPLSFLILYKTNYFINNCVLTLQTLLAILDSPLVKTDHTKIYMHTFENVLIEIDSGTRIPRTYVRFAKLIAQLLGTIFPPFNLIH